MESQHNLTAPRKQLLVRAVGNSSTIAEGGTRTGHSDPHANCCGPHKEGTLSHWDMRRNVSESFNSPSWDTKVKPYNPGVMVGNWAEERLRKDYVSQNLLKENVHKRDPSDYYKARSAALQTRVCNENGASNSYMFKQHDTLYNNNQITVYDENYNQRWREKKLPKLRHWHLTNSAWLPEKTDHPLFGPPTQFGLFDSMKKKWDKELRDKGHTYYTMYQSKYLSRFPGHFIEPQQKMNFSYTHHFPRFVC